MSEGMCDCELGHNGMGMVLRECDCPAFRSPAVSDERDGDREHMLEAMRTALVSLEQGDDPALAQRYLRTCLRKFGR